MKDSSLNSSTDPSISLFDVNLRLYSIHIFGIWRIVIAMETRLNQVNIPPSAMVINCIVLVPEAVILLCYFFRV